ncbi:MAG: toprim domain-containing protein, partial [Gammaproteobacteria bacterium]|nr:toprim domain-containing protein [Gammaproteobacteria bacterium]
MNESIAERIRQRLDDEFNLNKQSADGKWLQGGTCPGCDKKELFTRYENPWVIRCGRESKCGYEGHVKDLYPDAFENFNKRFQPTEKSPNATADAYLKEMRGFDIGKIKGWYEQGKFWSQADNSGTATVRFYLDAARTIHMERFVEEILVTDKHGEKKKRKAHFKGSHQGMAWAPPGMEIKEGDEVWIVEAILDAIALALNGIKAVAILSCVNYPRLLLEQHKGQDITWVWALDNDKAGRKWIRRHVKRMRAEGVYDIKAALPPSDRNKLDWNDLHQREAFSKKNIDDYFYYGELVLAESAKQKALTIYNYKNKRDFYLDYDNRVYWFNLDVDKFDKKMRKLEEAQEEGKTLSDKELRDKALEDTLSCVEIANCKFTFLYFQANLITDESWYYARVEFPHGGKAVKNTFTGGQLSSSSEFKKRLLSIAAGSLFTGESRQLDRIIQDQLYALKIVQTVDFLGYSNEHGCYVFKDIAVKGGQVFPINDEDFFDIGKLSTKCLSQSTELSITQDKTKYQTEWVKQLYGAFG